MSASKRMAWFVWLIASLFYAYQYVLRVMPNVMLDDIMKQFNIEASLFGQFSGAYYIGYCLMHLPIGIMLDRYGPKKIMSLCIVLTAVGLLPIALSDHWIYPILGRFLIGVGSSAAILGTFKVIRMTFKEGHFSMMLGLSVTIGLLGAIYGNVPVSYLCQAYSHTVVIEAFAVLGILFAFLTYFVIPEIDSPHETSIWGDLKAVFSNQKVLWICFFSGLMVGPMEGFADAWGSEFLKRAYGFETQTANFLTSMIYIGMCFGSIILNFIAEKKGYYFETIIGAGLIMCFIFVLLVGQLLTEGMILVAFILVGICSSYQILAIYKASTCVAEEVVSLTTATTNMIIMSFGYAFHSLIGIIVRFYSDTSQSISFLRGIGIIPLTLVLGTAGFLVLFYQEKRQKI